MSRPVKVTKAGFAVAKKMFDSGSPAVEIARKLNVSDATVYRMRHANSYDEYRGKVDPEIDSEIVSVEVEEETPEHVSSWVDRFLMLEQPTPEDVPQILKDIHNTLLQIDRKLVKRSLMDRIFDR